MRGCGAQDHTDLETEGLSLPISAENLQRSVATALHHSHAESRSLSLLEHRLQSVVCGGREKEMERR